MNNNIFKFIYIALAVVSIFLVWQRRAYADDPIQSCISTCSGNCNENSLYCIERCELLPDNEIISCVDGCQEAVGPCCGVCVAVCESQIVPDVPY